MADKVTSDRIKTPVSLYEGEYDGPLLSLLDAEGVGVAQFYADDDYPQAKTHAQRVVDTINALCAERDAMCLAEAQARHLLGPLWAYLNERENLPWTVQDRVSEAGAFLRRRAAAIDAERGVQDPIRALLLRGATRIEAVKAYRNLHGTGLRESLAAVVGIENDISALSRTDTAGGGDGGR